MIHTLTCCETCNALIVWMKTAEGDIIPVNFESWIPEDDLIFDPKTMVSHYETCPQADP